MLELVLILLPKVRNIFLSFPVSEAKGQKSYRRSVIHSNTKKGNNTLCSLLLTSLKYTHMVSKNVSFLAYLIGKLFFLFLQGVGQRSYQQQPEKKVDNKMSIFRNIKSHFLPGTDLPTALVWSYNNHKIAGHIIM